MFRSVARARKVVQRFALAAGVLITFGGALVITSPAAFAAGGGTLADVTISPQIVTAGTSAQGTVTLTAPVATDTVVTLASTDTTVLNVPASLTVPAGATSGVFTITTRSFTDAPGNFACVNATAGVTLADCLNVNPAPSGPALSSVKFSPATVVGGSGDTATVTFASAPSGGRLVSLTSSNPAVASVPSSAVVLDGQKSAAFLVTTSTVTATTSATVAATADGTTVTGTLTITPGTPPTADTIHITTAQWRRGILQIKATSTNPGAILSVYDTASDEFWFTLTNAGGGKYQTQRESVNNLTGLSITVRSNFGGTATASIN